MAFQRKYVIVLFFAVAIFSLVFNEYNRKVIIKNNHLNIETNDRSLVYNSTIFSVDNDWYLPQIKNFTNGKGFTSNPNKPHYDVRRTPVYPMFYAIHYILFGETKSFFFIRFTQILLFALATIALLFATFNFTKNKTISIICALLFGFNPTLVSYLYFTITEAISPVLVCFILYFLSYCYTTNCKKNWFFVGLFFAMGSLCRANIFFFIFAIILAIIYINKKSLKNIIASGFIFFAGASTLFIPHVIRNFVVTDGDFILLEKYYDDPMDFGIPNIKLRNWISCWTNPADYSSEVISAQIKLDIVSKTPITKEKTIETFIENLPKRAMLVNKKQNIKNAYSSLYDYYFIKYKTKNKEDLLKQEKICVEKMQQLKTVFVTKAPMQFYVVTPILVIKSIIFQSNSSTIKFLDNYQTSTIKKIIKTKLYLLNVFLFFALIASIFYIRKYFLVYSVCLLFAAVNIVYITFVLKYFEARYLVPIFPCMYIIGAIFLVESYTRIKQKLHF